MCLMGWRGMAWVPEGESKERTNVHVEKSSSSSLLFLQFLFSFPLGSSAKNHVLSLSLPFISFNKRI